MSKAGYVLDEQYVCDAAVMHMEITNYYMNEIALSGSYRSDL